MSMPTVHTYPVCPRCSGWIPNNTNPGEYPGATSRTDNKTEICSRCGEVEAWEQMRGDVCPQDHWDAMRAFRGDVEALK